MSSFFIEEQKGLANHLEGLLVPLVARVPQFGNHCYMLIFRVVSPSLITKSICTA